MLPDNSFQCIGGQESSGSGVSFGIKIYAALIIHAKYDEDGKELEPSRTIDLRELCRNVEPNFDKIVGNASWNASQALYKALWKYYESTNTVSIERGKKQKAELLECFGDRALYVKEIPNGYCNDPCCMNLPWLIVTTKVGPIVIGWRKSVISIAWTDTDLPDAETLFPEDKVTKYGKLIHAWGYEVAKKYLDKLVSYEHHG